MTKPGDLKLAYLMVSSPVPNVYIGGLMVTDSRGLPVEFRYTEPIQPSKIQQVLYGQVLSAYIKREVILETLLKNIESKFKCLLVEDEHLVDYPAKGYGIVRIAATKSSPLGAVGKTQELAPGEMLLQITTEGCPIRLNLTPSKGKSPEESGSTGSSGPNGSSSGSNLNSGESGPPADITSLLLEAGQTMDIVEPLKRIEKALEIICQEEGVTAGTPPTAR